MSECSAGEVKTPDVFSILKLGFKSDFFQL